MGQLSSLITLLDEDFTGEVGLGDGGCQETVGSQ